MSNLLPFHTNILDIICGEETNDLLVIARGLGLRRIVCTLLKIYESPSRLILLINSSNDEENNQIGDELGIMGVRRNPGFKVVNYETSTKDRKQLYIQGGLISVTSRILVVDMLQGDIPIHLISGILVLHAEKVTPLTLEAFIVRLYREKNDQGFLKAFTDQPEHITSGLSPLKNIMKELKLTRVHIYPRFQDDVKNTLEKKRADVIELSQKLTDPMDHIQSAIIHCINATLSELKKSNTYLDLDDFNLENAYFRQFDLIVRRQLDTVWHQVGPKTKQLVHDLGTLRQLLGYLLTYDALQFHAYCETLLAAETSSSSGVAKKHHPPWLLSDSANVIFTLAKERCYTIDRRSAKEKNLIDLSNDEDDWAAMDALYGIEGTSKESQRPSWLPAEVNPVCEELPKWNLLNDVLLEIEEEIVRIETIRLRHQRPLGNNIVLVMTSSDRSVSLITEFLSTIDPDAPPGKKGHRMMLRKLRLYLWWKKQLKERGKDAVGMLPPNSATFNFEDEGDGQASAAMRKKDQAIAAREKNRRRVRGGAPVSSRGGGPSKERLPSVVPQEDEDAQPLDFDSFWSSQVNRYTETTPTLISFQGPSSNNGANEDRNPPIIDIEDPALQAQFEDKYGLVTPEESVIVRAYSQDGDDMLLDQLEPRFIVMVEPNIDFIRRIEVYRGTHPGYGVRVYHLVYASSSEEHRYLTGVRKEKESFERLIKEKATMMFTLEEGKKDINEDILKTINTRIAGGRREISKEPAQVVVDMREFRSTLPSLLHAASLLVIPATLTVGDYVITPDMCVERKSLSDLVGSFNNGRLYNQCELMSAHYKYPVLLIEFEEEKAFSLDVISDMRSYSRSANKFANTKQNSGGTSGEYTPTVQSKIVLLTLHFPRLKIIWSSSPYATADIFKDLKRNNPEPDPKKAITIGSEDVEEVGGINTAAEELLRNLPGISSKNVRHVTNSVQNVKEFCVMNVEDVQKILGNEPGKVCWEFIHKGDRKRT